MANTFYANKSQGYIANHLSCRSDGPVTTFVLIARATEVVSQGGDPDVVANALYEELKELGAIKGDETLLSSNEY